MRMLLAIALNGRLKEIDLNILLSFHCYNSSGWQDLRYNFMFLIRLIR